MSDKEAIENFDEVAQKYIEEYARDSVVDELRMGEIQLKIPGIKGKWASYKLINKLKLNKLLREKAELLNRGVDMIYEKKKDEGHNVTRTGAEKILRRTEKFRTLDEKIQNLTELCEYFDKCVKFIGDIHWDVKNWVDTKKIDEM